MLLLNRYGLEQLVWCMIPGLLVALLVAKTNYSRPAKEGVVTTTSFSHPESNKATLWIALRPELRPLIVLYLITTLRTVTTVGVLNFLSLHLDQQDFSTHRAFGSAFPLCIRGFNGHHDRRLPFRSD